jgi:excisionase family DNA binding protein
MAKEPIPGEMEYLTPGQVARLLHVSPKTVTRWAQEGRIPCLVTLGGHRRFRRADVDRAVGQMAGGEQPVPDSGGPG